VGSDGTIRRVREGLWTGLDRLLDEAADGDVRSHRLEVLAARRRRETGRPVPTDFVEHERLAAMAAITAPVVLARVAAATGEPLVLVKGAEVAARYPDPALRGFWDVDLIAIDPGRVQEDLLAAGFEPVGDPALYEGIHHLRPLQAPGLLLAVEIHATPKWLEGRSAPSAHELLAAASPRPGGPATILALPPEQHALLLAAHSWAHEPLRRLRDIVDIAVVAAAADRNATRVLARRWGIERLWRTTEAVTDWLDEGARVPRVQRLWARNLVTARERTVLESHLERVTSDFWARGLGESLRRVPGNVLSDLRPDKSERWSAKLRRSALAVRNARRPRSEHEGQRDR
jgi:hypothetical protein